MTEGEKQEIEYYLRRIEKVKRSIIHNFIVKKQEKWFESDCGHEIANDFHLRYLYAKVDKMIGNL